MLKKSKRLSTEEFNLVLEKGRVVHSPFFTIRVLGGMEAFKISVVSPKKIYKTAVSRNRSRRVIYAILASFLDKFKSSSYILIFPKTNILDMDHMDLMKNLEQSLAKAGLL